MTTVSQNKDLVRRFNSEFIEGQQIASFQELVSPSFINHNAPPGHQGSNDTLQFFQQILWPALSGLRVEILDQISEGDRVVTRKILHAIHTKELMGIQASDIPVKIKVMDILRIAGGQLVEHWGILDLHDLQQPVAI